MIEYICSNCGKRVPINTTAFTCSCSGLFSLPIRHPFTMNDIDTGEWSLFRYRKFFPLQDEGWRQITLGEGMTPVVSVSENLMVKVDYEMPTLSFKDRGAAMVIWLCKTLGVRRVVQDSSGNAGNSIAAYCAKAGIECTIFVPMGTSPKKIKMIQSHGAIVEVVQGSRDDTARACRERVVGDHVFYASHVYNPFFYQGTKTYLYEIYEQLGQLPENLFIPVGNGTLLMGVFIALDEMLASGLIKTLPQIYAVQSEMCAPLAIGYNNGQETAATITPQLTLAEGIAIGEPMRHKEILKYCRKYSAHIVTAPECGIMPAKEELAQKGYFVEDTTAATYAAYKEIQNKIIGRVLIPLCGAGLKSEK